VPTAARRPPSASAELARPRRSLDGTLQLEGTFPGALAALAAQRFPRETLASACERLSVEHILPLADAVDTYRRG
jgi:hypothetical protein